MNTDFDWKQEGALDDLKRLHEGGYSCSQIALELSAAFTGTPSRNAVIGKLFRLGLVSKHGRGRPPAFVPTKRKPRPNGGATPQRVSKFVPPPPLPEPQSIDLPPDQSDCAVTLMELEPHHCRFPIGEPRDMTYCGARKHGEYPYCARHCRMAYQPRNREARPFKEYRRKVA